MAIPMCSIRNRQSPIRNSSEAGVVLLTTLLLLAVLFIIGMGGLMLSHTDLLLSRNLLTGTQTLWLARSGAEIGKEWLAANLPATPLPVTLGPRALGAGDYTVTITARGGGSYRLTATGRGREGSEQHVEETVHLPDFAPAGVVTSDGDGLHPDFDDGSGGTGRRLPDFSIDGRNHAPDGTLSAVCAPLSPFATTQVAAQNDVLAAADTLKRQVVIRANNFCLLDGSSSGSGSCTPGLFWVRGAAALPRFTTAVCVAADPACFVNLDLSAPALRATALPPASSLPPPPENRGPFTPGVATAPFVRVLTAAERTRLRTALDDIVHRADELPEEKILRVSASLTAGTHTYGTWREPKVTRVEDAAGTIDLSGGTVVDGAGILLIPRTVRLRDATLNWQGIVLITGSGDLQVEDGHACGRILGAVVVRDDAAADRKLDLDRVARSGGCAPLALNYSCEAVTRALTVVMRTVAWIQDFGG